MSAPLQAYRLATPAQWQDGVLAGVAACADGRLRPFAPYGRAALALGPADGADLPAIGRDGSAWWRGAGGALYRLARGASRPEVFAPYRFACGRLALAAGCSVLWLAGRGQGQLHCYDQHDLRELFEVELDGARIVGLAPAERDGLWVLVHGAHGQAIVRLDHAGRAARPIPLKDQPEFSAIAALGQPDCLALLARDGSRVSFVAAGRRPGPVLPTLALAALEAGATARLLAGDGAGGLCIGIRDGSGRSAVLVCSVGGDLEDRIALDAEPAGIAAAGAQLLVAGAGGATLYRSDEASAGTPASCELITPVLSSPARADGRGWLRAELSAQLPAGAWLEVKYAGTDDAELRAEAQRVARDRTLTPAQRLARLDKLLGGWSEPVRYSGSAGAGAPRTLAAPLFDARSEHLWLRIRLGASQGSALPRLGPVRVLYPDRSLMERLPAIYRNEERNDFLRSFVGVLEATTQDLDRRIAGLGALLDPASTDKAWLDYMARWFDLPWDDALETAQKRALLRAAPQILPLRGTRQALEAMLGALFPGAPPRFTVSDTASGPGPARLNASALPALLSGLPARASVLGRRAALGQACLSKPAGVARPSRVRIEITASLAERRQAAPWLPAMVGALMPVTARAVLAWRETRTDGSGVILGADTVLGEAPDARLGENSVIGAARLRPGHVTRLPSSGASVGFRLG